MAFSVTPIAGVNLTTPQTVASGNLPSFGPLGTEVFGSDGKRYVYGQAGAAIAASSATVVVNASTFVATLGVGSYFTAASMASGDYGWFSIASV